MPTAPVSPTLEDEIAFISGVNSDGTVAAVSGQTWTGEGPDSSSPDKVTTYNPTESQAAKFGSSTAGTTGGTIDYYFDPASNWTAEEQAVFNSSLALWSAEANIQFQQIADPSTVSASQPILEINRVPDGGAYELGGSTGAVAIGGTTLGTHVTSSSISVNTNYFSDLTTSFSTSGGTIGSILHEGNCSPHRCFGLAS